MSAKFTKIICAIFFFICFSNIEAQQYSFSHYGIPEGLGSSNALCMYQDSRNYLWVSTSAGLSRFNGTSFRNFTAKDGITSYNITSIHEDANGLLWFKSRRKDNLIKYDGYHFETTLKDSIQTLGVGRINAGYNGKTSLWINENNKLKTVHPDIDIILENADFLKHNYINDMYILDNQHVYLATDLGLVVYKNGKYENLTTKIKRTTQIQDIEVFGDKFLLRTDEGLMFFDGEKFDNSDIPMVLRKNITQNMLPDNKGNMWFATIKGLYKYDGNEFIHFDKKDGLLSNRIYSIFIDSNDNIWLTLQDAQMLFDGKKFSSLDIYTSNVDFSHRYLYPQFLEDNEKNVWLTTKMGIAKFHGFHFLHYGKEINLASNQISSMLIDSKNNHWFAYYDKGLSFCNTDSCRHFTEKDGLSTDVVYDIISYNDDEIWLGTKKGLISYKNNKFQQIIFDPEDTEQIATMLVKDKAGNIWLSTRKNLYKYEKNKFKKYQIKALERPFSSYYYRVINDFLIDEQNNVWVASLEGMFRLNATTDEFEYVGGEQFFDIVRDMDTDSKGNLWIVKEEGGLIRYDGKFIVEFSELEGLSSNNIRSIIISDDVAFLGTVNGVNQFDIKKYNTTKKIDIQHIGKEKGFINIECWNVAYADKNKDLWFTTPKGITCYKVNELPKTNKTKQVQINKILLNYEDVDWAAHSDSLNTQSYLPENLALEYHENTLTFHYKTLSFENANKKRYQYFLDGLEQEWQAPSKAKYMTYNDLDVGTYTFYVKEFNKNKIDANNSNIASFSFTILPPVWHYAWFWAFLFTLFTATLLSAYLLYFILIKRPKIKAFRQAI
ncbi:MAG: ligand-binding sensor domain-containing protein [Chitinophagales bacterium]